MLDRPFGAADYDLGRLSLRAGDRMLCLAPHPDDEVLGCGGLLALAHRQGLSVHTILLTAGEQGVSGDAQAQFQRLAESAAAAHVLGLSAPVCWHLADRELRYCDVLVERIAQALDELQPHWLLAPALTEPHPDHQALSLAAVAAARRYAACVDLLFYEVGAPMQPNTVVDIDSVAELKWRALDCFASQEERHGYLRHAQALSELRAFGHAPMQAAEAFWHLPARFVREPGATAPLAYWPLQRRAAGLAVESDELPLVSVVIRSMDRSSLAQAVDSVVEQTYPNIEIVLVNASGGPHPLPTWPPERLRLRLIPSTVAGEEAPAPPPQPLGRSAAANLGLEQARGSLALFLDDDDILGSTQIEKLVRTLHDHPRAMASYCGVRVEGPDGQWLRDYDQPWEPRRLQGINFLPIHAVLFRLDAVRGASLRFDETLPVLEDWDFWCQLAQLGAFVHLPGIQATYRQGLGRSHLGDPDHENHWIRWHERILRKHAQRWGVDAQAAALAWNATALVRAEQSRQHAEQALARAQEESQQLRLECDRLEELYRQLYDARMLRWARTLGSLFGRCA